MTLVKIENNIVVDALANGTVEWATDRFGGTWMLVDYPVGIGWVLNDGVIEPPNADTND